jgi:hypothetical protein
MSRRDRYIKTSATRARLRLPQEKAPASSIETAIESKEDETLEAPIYLKEL